ncbi:MAG: ADP-ribosylglycohydrolase family protein [Verrucomicrobiota bacterium]
MNDPCQRVLLGTAIGDSIGLPAEGMSRQAIERRWKEPLKHRFLFGRGMISDDTEHTVFVAQALIDHAENPIAFQKALAWKLKFWLICIPAGIGLATLRSILKLWIGFSPNRSGVYSAGNGPAMRSAVIGAFFAGRPDKIAEFTRVSTRLTHTDPKAETAAVAIAYAAAWAVEHDTLIDDSFIEKLKGLTDDDQDWHQLVDAMAVAMKSRPSVREFADTLGLYKGVSGYCYHTVPVALYAWWLHYGDYQSTIEEIISCGGDTDTTAAIAGALAAIRGEIPETWLTGLRDYPISVSCLEKIGYQADQAAKGEIVYPLSLAWWFLPIRNLCFFLIVLVHGFRRLIPC